LYPTGIVLVGGGRGADGSPGRPTNKNYILIK
jgi:hypothetical protein